MLLENNTIDLKVGDVFRFNRARKHNTIINEFDYNGETYMVFIDDAKYPSMEISPKEKLCGVYPCCGNYFDAVVEVNGKQVRGLGGKLLDTPKDVSKKKVVKKVKPSKKDLIDFQEELTDFQRFIRVQRSGVINMTDIVTGSRLAGISESKYEDILWHYDEYKTGKRN